MPRTCGLARLIMVILAAPTLLMLGGCLRPYGSDELVAGTTSEPPKLVTDSSGHFRTRAKWPVGSPLYVGFRESSVNRPYAHSRTMRVRSEFLDSEEGAWWIRPGGVMYSMKPMPWDDEMRLMGTPDEVMSAVQLTRRMERYQGKDEPLVLSRGTSTLRVRIEGTVDDVLTPVVLPDLDEAIAKRLNATFYRRGWNSDGETRLWVATYVACAHDPDDPRYPGICQDLGRHPDVTFAARFDVIHRGDVVASARAWWRNTSGTVSPFEGELRVEIPVADLHERDLNDGQWSLRVVSDPDTALRDLGSSRYWEGDVTVPLRVTDARNWEELKAEGEASTE